MNSCRKHWYFLAAACLLAVRPISAQTNGTWTGTAAGNWSNAANWQGGTIADGGGIATFNDLSGQTAGFTITVDTARTLSEIRYDSGYSYTIATALGQSINMSGSGLTLNSQYSLVSSPSTFFTTANTITAVIAGTGDLIKTGEGFTNLGGANTFTGTVRINQGTLWVNTGLDSTLGNLGNTVELNGGVFGVNGILTSNRNFVIGANGGTFQTFTALTLNGTLTGSGTLTKQLNNANMTITGDGTGFTGEIQAQQAAIIFFGNGRVGGSAVVDVAGTLSLDNAGTNLNNRLNGRSMIGRAGTITLSGNAGAATTESLGTLTLAQGNTTVSITPNAGQSTTMNFTDIVRQNNATLFVRGTNLGNAPGAGVGTFTVTNSPGTLIGGGGDPNASTTASILPWAYGNSSATATALSTFLTWDAGTQRFVLLNTATGYATDITTAGPTENVNQNASATLGAATTINSLRLAPTTAITIDGAPLTVTSGAILNTGATAFNVAINSNLTANAQELVLTSTNGAVGGTGLVINGAISGTGGLTRTGPGFVHLNGANTYTGTTTILNGTTVVSGGTVTGNGSAPSVFGQDASAINIHGSQASTRLWTTGNLIVNRDLAVTLSGSGVTSIGVAGLTTGESFTVNGNVSLSNPTNSATNNFLFLEGGPAASRAVTINGIVSGNGGLRGANAAQSAGTYVVLNGANTYSGGTILGGTATTTGTGVTFQTIGETWELGSNSALGTGTVYIQSATPAAQPIPGIGRMMAAGGPRTINNRIVLLNGFGLFDGSNPITLNGSFELNGSANNLSVVNVASAAAPVTINGAVSHGALMKTGVGTLTLAGTNTYSGQTVVREGVLSVASIGNGGTAGNLSLAPSTSGFLVLSGNVIGGSTGTLRYTGTGESSNRLFTVNGVGSVIDSSGSGALNFTNTGAITNSAVIGTFTGVTINANAIALALGSLNTAGLVVGTTLGNANLPVGTTITEVGANYIRLSNASTNGAQQTAQSVTLTLPAGFTSRSLTLGGSNTGLNTMAPLLVNGGLPLRVVKSGTGTWQLTNANTYSGGTTVSGGRLLVNNSAGSGTGTGAVVVGTGGTLGGTGSIGGAVTIQNGGTLNPGASPGVLTVNNNATFDAGSTYFVELDGATAGNGAGNHDQLIITGAANSLTLATTGAGVTLAGSVGFTPTGSEILRIVDNQGNNAIVGTFAGLAEGSQVQFGGLWTAMISYVGGTGNDIVLSGFSPVPEPSAIVLVGLVAAGAWALRRRRMSQR